MARTAPTTGRGRQVLAGIGAVAVVAVVVALPVLFVWAAGNPLPRIGGWLTALADDPSTAAGQIWHALSSRDNGDLFLQTLALIGWVAAVLAAWTWVTFLVALVMETVAQLRGRRHGRVPRNTARIPGTRLQQRAAAALVAAILGALAAPALASAAVPAAIASPAVAAPDHATPEASAPLTAVPMDAPAAVGYLEHSVERGESLLDIAERYNLSWQRLAEVNNGLAQPDGRSLQLGNTRVYAGWTLRIPVVTSPAALTTSTQAPPAARTRPLVYEVARGDWLAGVAERFLGDADRYSEIAANNPDLEHRDHRFPHHIERGWRIALPEDARDRGPADHAQGRIVAGGRTQPVPSAPKGNDQPTAPRPPDGAENQQRSSAPHASATPDRPSASPAVTPSASASPPMASAPQATARPTADSATSDSDHHLEQRTEDGDSDEAIVLGSLAGAGLLSALLLTAVLRRRSRQRQHRRPGRRLPHPRGGATERALRVAEQPADVDRLDLALRSLAAALAEREQPLPDIAAAWIVDQAVTVVLTEPAPEPPAPWSDDRRHWTLPANATVPAVTEQLAPLPTLVAVGSQPGRHLLLDLERLGSLTIAGDSERTLALLRYLACELACNAWSDEVEVVVTGFPVRETELLSALNPDRVRVVSSVGEAAARLRRRAGAVRGALNASGAADTFAGRIIDVGEAWVPQVLLVADPDEDDLGILDELGKELQDAGRCAVAVASTTRAHATAGPNTAIIDEDGQLHLALPFLLVDGAAAGLPVRELEPLIEIMTQARAATDERTPLAAEPEAWADGTDAAGSVLDLLTAGKPATAERFDDADTASADTSASPDPIVAVPHIQRTRTVTTVPRREVTAAIRQRRRQADPELDSDLRAWREQDKTRPRISVLGAVAVEAPGPVPDQRRRFHAELIVYLAQRGVRGASAEQLTDALWPDQQVKDASRRVAITRARRWLGETPDGTAWLPEMGADRLYRLESGYLLDWHLFRRLRSRGESRGAGGVKDLRAALELVRGVPLDGAERAYAAGARNPFTWLPESDIYPGHLTSAIVDTAHELAGLYLDAGDITGARWAVQQAWLADPERGDDGPWHDILRAAHAEGHTAELRNLLGELMRVREAEVPEDLAPVTYALLRELLPDLLAATSGAG
ncbi:LysM peptidoglycan-binding domain-containing protein [Micromonospora sp. WMMA1947]|uniref:LysM peptidoglycan-binding domain-containing protein n=1 Tax=Micromonospora sp. WMMA1947 TaxID=3015163 RepID=UPI00248B5C0F|nr:LysM peptidoglycan-binding domain-containing protein [Micromonospora sp. WMMA1947]WBC08891.1 LysM peptidoglycan-binding domain-containing protein [Micromonospora sp. WMMA1947]